ncbi:MBL fold metallo-hydrolase [Thalassospira tepidiphila]|jgi:hypothetical protein|uniref:MBL fold metallo-hydrolase n=1 Tax=Thalassospira tepidiphila TaxID=393657 RepID=UPI001BCBF2FA|nr:MBL fold metallo-hydrolase [Thalassospira tepidiphila]MBS8274322.1 MBL fold metallo-hydrolase [Thalassospira tepidiphila]|tara:strand:- start:540 stop:1853 length:1314 start_codon:yes stop_codon:yes gene_type:complete
MNDELIALPVSGESFLLRRGKHTVLVDGGYNSTTLAKKIDKIFPKLDFIDIIVCTHADADHSKGLAKFLDAWSPSMSSRKAHSKCNAGQFWLPGRWADVLPDLVTAPRKFIDGLISELDDFISENSEKPDLSEAFKDYCEQLNKDILKSLKPNMLSDLDGQSVDVNINDLWDEHSIVDTDLSSQLNVPEWFAIIQDEFEKKEKEADKAFTSAYSKIRYRKIKCKIGEIIAKHWIKAIDTAKNIHAIAVQAAKYNVPIRWFDYECYSHTRKPVGGERNFLIPLNSVELSPPMRTSLGYLARLSVVNQECLTFLAPPSLNRMGVVFCGDSPMGDGPSYTNSFLKNITPPMSPIVATAPHHGSDSNKVAYHHLSKWPVFCWVRTGGTKKHPGNTFKSLWCSKRICTHCPQSGKKIKIMASVRMCSNFYFVVKSGYDCTCR